MVQDWTVPSKINYTYSKDFGIDWLLHIPILLNDDTGTSFVSTIHRAIVQNNGSFKRHEKLCEVERSIRCFM